MDIATQIKQIMIDSLALEDLTIEDIDNDLELFSEEGLGLDSVDALELGLELQKKFGFTFNAEQTNLNQHFRNVNTLTNFIQSQLAVK
ncbi:phosphopantetheine-binding protein [Psittacicella gerlachiana]|uniref:Acyl carrier protein n=1 Tax=Psittacicella gerlachiana TaxID=2028574 RepID=A0A3A1YGM7_9GAMM|nr:phosphopantetheine-binding protein [Psittacicella gerlachiana]RIY36835.1 acyl carrier protein [Psittacicella gerlachiana]